MKCWSISRSLGQTLLLGLVISRIASAANIEWIRPLGSSGDDHGTGVSADGLGNVYMSGSTGGSLDGPFAGGYFDAFVSKYDASGNLLWTRQRGTDSWDEANSVVADGLGNVYIAGETSGTLGNAHVATTDSFVCKYDAAGNLLWTSQFNTSIGPFGGQYTNGISADSLGNLYVTGYTSVDSNSTNLDAYVTKLDVAGNLKWTRRFGSGRDEKGYGISADGLGNVYITGSTNGSLDGRNVGNALFTDAFVTKLDSAGNLVWSRQLGENYSDYGFAAAADGQGNVYIAGATQASLGGVFAGGFHDAFVAKYDVDGNVVWIRQLGGKGADEAYGITIDYKGGVYITGNTDKLTDDPPTRIGNSFAAKYDVDGNLLWGQQLGHPGSRAISIDNLGALYVSGRTYDSLGGLNAGMEDAFLAKISNVPEPCTLTLAMLGATLICTARRRGS